jgi:hypothetical protein
MACPPEWSRVADFVLADECVFHQPTLLCIGVFSVVAGCASACGALWRLVRTSAKITEQRRRVVIILRTVAGAMYVMPRFFVPDGYVGMNFVATTGFALSFALFWVFAIQLLLNGVNVLAYTATSSGHLHRRWMLALLGATVYWGACRVYSLP